MSRSYQVSFEASEPKTGDFTGLRFVVMKEGSSKQDYIVVEMSRTVETKFKGFGISGDDLLIRVAARTVEQHLLGCVPSTQYSTTRANTIAVNTLWYPGHSGAPETIDDFEKFVVTLPPPPLGFKTPTSKT